MTKNDKDSDGGKRPGERRSVHKPKSVEKQWRKGTGRWRFSDEEAVDDLIARKLSNPRLFQSNLSDDERDALVVQTGGPMAVLNDGSVYFRARPRRSTTTENKSSSLVSIGDKVRYIVSGDDDAVITHVYERQSYLLRTSIRSKEFAQVLVANLDQVVVTAAATEELLRPGLIDRYLVATAMGGLHAVICINKIDILDEENEDVLNDIVSMYRETGYTVVATSCVTGAGLVELERLLTGKISAFSGHSGVGKTSLLNILIPELNEKTQELSDQSQRGIHTTTRSTLYDLPSGGYIADTPGIREFGLFQFEPGDLHTYYPEFLAFADSCRYPDCMHTHEPDCAVRDAVEDGRIHPLRYRNYLQIMESEMHP